MTLAEALTASGFLEATATAFMLRDASGHVVDVNDRAERVFGCSRDDLMSDDPTRLTWDPVHQDGSAFARDELPFAVALATLDPVYGEVQGLLTPTGERRWYTVNAYPIVHDDQCTGVLLAYLDAGERVRRAQLVDLLLAVAERPTHPTGEAETFQHLCRTLVEAGPFALSWVGVAHEGPERRVDIVEAAGLTGFISPDMVSWSTMQPNGLGPTGIALRGGHPVVVNDMALSPMVHLWRDKLSRYDLRSAVVLPFRPAGRRAVLTVYDRHPNTFDELTVAGLERIVREAERVIAHSESMRRLSTALEGTLAALSQVTEARDPYTAGHQVRVGALASALGTRLGLDADLVRLVGQAGDVHDVGKIALASEILIKPGRLSDLEMRMVRRHSSVGHEILARASLPWPIPEVALQHHERLDGSGYPGGLEASAIGLPARIVAVADVIEAMSSHRPYRPVVGRDEALAFVEVNAGTLFDRDVVTAAHDVLGEGFHFPEASRPSIVSI